MKITYRRFPVLKELISKNTLSEIISKGSLPIHEKEKYYEEAIYRSDWSSYWPKWKKAVRENIYLVEDSIETIYTQEKTYQKLIRLKDEIEGLPLRGCVLRRDGWVCMYDIWRTEVETIKTVWVRVLAFVGLDLISYMTIGWQEGKLKECMVSPDWFDFASMHNRVFGEKYSKSEYFERAVYPAQSMLAFNIFKQFAEIETVFVSGNKKRAKGQKEKYTSLDFPHKITIINSNWFQNIVRTEGFKVSGHFRLQPFGPGRKERKLIWVNEFKKHGYTLKARKSKEDEL